MQRPNFLFIITDQQRADSIGAYGARQCRTPNLDGLAARGWTSESFHVATPICMPNRSSLMTGVMPSVHGVRHNGIPLDQGINTFVKTLATNGYRTAHVGKSHLQNISGNTPMIKPAAGTYGEALPTTPGRYDQEWAPAWNASPDFKVALPFYGFQSVDLTINHGDAVFGDYRKWLAEREPMWAKLIGDHNAMPAPEYELTAHHQAWKTRIPADLHPTAYTASRTIDRLREFKSADEPFFLHCSFSDPHHPLTPPGKYWSMYSPEDVTLPESFHADHHDLPPHVAWTRTMRDSGKAVKNTQALFAVTEREAREAIALTYGLITYIDDQIGRILAALDELGLADNTIVVFTSDHGEYLGDHQLFLKGPVHYRSLIRTAFIWADPQGASGAPGTRSKSLAGTLDIAPTILERAGVPLYHGLAGRSLLPAMNGRDEQPRETWLIEEEGQRHYLGFDRRVRCRTLVTERYRLTVYDGVQWGELYDYHADPLELANRWSDTQYAAVRSDLLHRLSLKMIEAAATSPAPTSVA